MTAMTLNCPMCGAAAASDSSKCAHCGARLATVACPACFGMVFLGAQFCSHCGAAVSRQEKDISDLQCPRCHVPLTQTLIGEVELSECPRCEGLWADAAALHSIQTDREHQAAVLTLGAATPLTGSGTAEATVRYIYCPVCGEFMNRVNFARCSNVVVDVCKPHGTWLDRDELRRIVEFIQAGGLQRSRQREIAELEHRRRQLAAEKADAATEAARYGRAYDPRRNAISMVGRLLADFFS